MPVLDIIYRSDVEVPQLDDLDRQVIHALALAPRATFRQLAAVLGVSDQTAARRYRDLRSRAGLRVLGRIDGRRLGWAEWFVRLQCAPDAALAVAGALARRPDTSWVSLASGGTEIICVVDAPTPADRDELLLEKLTANRRIVGISAHSLLHTFRGRDSGWQGLLEALDDVQIERLGAEVPAPSPRPGDVELAGADHALLTILRRDGRTPHAELAAATSWHESTVRRRIEQLRAAGVLFFDVDVDDGAYGITERASLWMSVVPDRLAAVGEAMAGHREVPFVAATTGSTNLVASVCCSDVDTLYEYLSSRVGALGAATAIETTPIIRTLKRSGSVPS